MDSHRAAFVAEAEDGITDLNNALLALEADPGDSGAIDDVFRVAHTLKGNAAAMGYDGVSELAHTLEDLLDDVRTDDLEVTPELMDLLFEGVDAIEAMVGEIADDGEVRTDAGGIERRLREWETDDGLGDGDDTGSGTEAIDELDADSSELVRASVRIGETAMPGVDATFVLETLQEIVDAFATDPDPELLEDGEYGDGFDAYLPAADGAGATAAIEELPQVERVETVPLGGGPDSDDDREGDASPSENETDDPAGGTGSEEPGGEKPDDDEKPDDEKPDDEKSNDEISTIRVDVEQVDELYGLVEQLVTSRIKLRRELESAGVESDALDELDKLANSLQDTAMDMRLVPFSQVADSFPRLVRDVARDVDKQVAFEMEGGDVELDRTILTEMRDPLVHVLRNAVDHGIESPEEREAAGKDPTGTVELTATRSRDHVVIEVSDDGAGIDPDELAEKAIDEGVVTREEVTAMDDGEIYDLVFHPGLSTAEEVTDVSGRGVGMDVVRTTARGLDGSVSIDSEPGAGTTIRFRLPVTVAIVKVMFVRVGDTEYGIPIKSIAEVSRADDVAEVHGEEVIRHEDDLYPVIRLADRLGERPLDTGGEMTSAAASTSAAATDGGDANGVDTEDGMLVRIREETRQVALHCDEVLDQEEIVVKPLEGPLSGTPGIGGTAVLGDGDVVAVLDVMSL
ncbi:chemotaxis protein CheA [Halalkaliarchaeum sp. AArc-GB]|uniref:chemotaxis protein CheA n=1 Tax=Halalkaliarchaeum sp. AArc-GB TaxID=3074078 RepID=UPI0028648E26|nr:chemotaxis protein CheA [Halalkaliarchaeum sp. AArc-GB]MDR5674423.1 chemotaxis protein CheA [Halalkaliarchaeum sp. AArc-GB]